MIYNNSFALDMNDVAVLFAAMVTVNDSELAEQADRCIIHFGYAEALARCTKAAQIVAEQHREQGDDWDGVWWFEIFESSREGCLAHQLFMLDVTEEDDSAEWDGSIRAIVLEWLNLHQGVEESEDE